MFPIFLGGCRDAPASKQMKFEAKIERERREAQGAASWLEARNDARVCPWIYPGFEEPPNLRRAGVVGSIGLAEKLERVCGSAVRRVCAESRADRGQRRFDREGAAHA